MHQFLLGEMKMFWKWTVVIITQHCECTYCHWIINLKWLNGKFYVMCVICVWLCDPTRLLCPWDFSRQEYWSVLQFPPPGDLPDPELNLRVLSLLHWQVDSLPLNHMGSPLCLFYHNRKKRNTSNTIYLLQIHLNIYTHFTVWNVLHDTEINMKCIKDILLCSTHFTYSLPSMNNPHICHF